LRPGPAHPGNPRSTPLMWDELPRRFSGHAVLRLIANHPHFAIFESTPEVRVLSSAGVTQLPRSYDPVRHPPDPSLWSGVEAATSDPDGSPSITRITIPTCCVQYPGRPGRYVRRLLPCPRGLPRAKGGSASASTLSRPARTSLALRPVGSLGRPRRPLSRGFDPASFDSLLPSDVDADKLAAILRTKLFAKSW